MSLQWTAPTLCDHAKHQDSGLHSLQKYHVTTTVDSCYNTPNPHTGATPSARLATTTHCYICWLAVCSTHYSQWTQTSAYKTWFLVFGLPMHLIDNVHISISQPTDIWHTAAICYHSVSTTKRYNCVNTNTCKQTWAIC